MKFNARIKKICYQSPENYWTSIILINEKDKEVKATGIMPDVVEGMSLKFEAEWKVHPKYGKQLNIIKYSQVLNTDKEGIIAFLANGFLKGIGEAKAHRIYEMFGDQTYKILENDIKQLTKIKGISEKSIIEIEKSWKNKKELKDVHALLHPSGITPLMCAKIFESMNGFDIVSKINENPYILVTKVDGIGFLKADHFATSIGVKLDDSRRIAAAIIFSLEQYCSSTGHCYMYLNEVLTECSKLLRVCNSSDIVSTLRDMIKKEVKTKNDVIHRMIGDEAVFYFKKFYDHEINLSKEIIRLNEAKNRIDYNKALALTIEEYKARGFEISKEQYEAVCRCLENNFSILTGGPGTGKTTVTKIVIETLSKLRKILSVGAPTGRAAQRIKEVSGSDAMTIHRILGRDGKGFRYNHKNQLESDVVVIDETSMISLDLFYYLFSAIRSGTKIILIGDPDQLEPVGIGDVFRVLLNWHKITNSKLTKIFRQSEGSAIVEFAHKLNNENDVMIKKSNPHLAFFDECGFVSSSDVPDYVDYIANLYAKFAEKDEVQILTPMKNSDVGTINLNSVIQNKVNPSSPSKEEINYGDLTFRVGDRVIHTKNNYDLDSFNGDIGTIESIKDKNIIVDYPDKTVEYKMNDLKELSLAYAITIHKSQGSEFLKVIIPMFKKFNILLSKKLLYTGVTRAKSQVVIVGEFAALKMCISKDIKERRMYLGNLLLGVEGHQQELLEIS